MLVGLLQKLIHGTRYLIELSNTLSGSILDSSNTTEKGLQFIELIYQINWQESVRIKEIVSCEKIRVEEQRHYWAFEKKLEQIRRSERLSRYDSLHEESTKRSNSQKTLNKRRILGNEFTHQIGHYVAISWRIKACRLDLTDDKFCLVTSEIANAHFLKKYFENLIKVYYVSDELYEYLYTRYRCCFEEVSDLKINGNHVQHELANNLIEIEWRRNTLEERLFQISAHDSLVLQNYLRLFNFEFEAKHWYVALHLRNLEYDVNRNASPFSSYIPVIKYILRLGGWVVRLGRNDSKFESEMEDFRIIDYAGSENQCEELDISIIAGAKYFIGSASGLSEIASLFGIPILRTNGTQMGANIYKSNSIELPKLVRLKNGAFTCHISEFQYLLDRGYLDYNHLPKEEIIYEDNKDVEILDAFQELIDFDSRPATSRQKQIALLLQQRGYSPTTRFSDSFLTKHKGYFFGEDFKE